MRHAMHGGSCPYCKNYSSIRKDGKLYVHKGNVRTVVRGTRLECHASGLTREQAQELRRLVDSGMHVISAKVEMGLMPRPRK